MKNMTVKGNNGKTNHVKVCRSQITLMSADPDRTIKGKKTKLKKIS